MSPSPRKSVMREHKIHNEEKLKVNSINKKGLYQVQTTSNEQSQISMRQLHQLKITRNRNFTQ